MVAVVEGMFAGAEAALEDLNSGVIDVDEFRRRALASGIASHEDGALILDWVKGTVFLYDGVQLVDLAGLGDRGTPPPPPLVGP